MGPAKSLKELRSSSVEELIHEHDTIARNSVVGTSYYLEEIHRREQRDLAKNTDKLTTHIYYLTVFIALLTFINVAAVLVQIWILGHSQ